VRVVNVQATFEMDQGHDDDGWHLEFSILVGDDGCFLGRCETFGFSVEGKDSSGRWAVAALKIRPAAPELNGKLDAWVDAFSSDGKNRYWFAFPEAVKAGNRFIYGMDDSYVFSITSVSELGRINSDSEMNGASQ
jgi:hypothetical protein